VQETKLGDKKKGGKSTAEKYKHTKVERGGGEENVLEKHKSQAKRSNRGTGTKVGKKRENKTKLQALPKEIMIAVKKGKGENGV